MNTDITPTGYIGLHEAACRLGGVKDLSETDRLVYDTPDYLADAEAITSATTNLRQWLCDGVLFGYHRVVSGRMEKVPEVIWADSNACLQNPSPRQDPQFNDIHYFDNRGIEFDGKRNNVLLVEGELEKVIRDGAPPSPLLKIKGKPGRLKGDGMKPDENWLDKMQVLVTQGKTIYAAAADVFHENKKALKAGTTATDLNIIKRLYDKYRRSTRAGSPFATN
jgi:hypothetical protein